MAHKSPPPIQEESSLRGVRVAKTDEFQTLNAALLAKNGDQIIKNTPPEKVNRWLSSESFYKTVHDLLVAYERGGAKTEASELKTNLIALFRDSVLMEIFAQCHAKSQHTRFATGELVNSEVGRDMVLTLLKRPLTVASLVGAVTREAEGSTEDWKHFAYPEEVKSIKSNSELKDIHDLIFKYLERGNSEDLDRIENLVSDDHGKELLAQLIGTVEFRAMCKYAISGNTTRDRVADVMIAGKEALELALNTPEGINTLGMLNAAEGGKSLVSHIFWWELKGPLFLVMILRKQGAFLDKYKKEHGVPPWLEN